jgi:hypothetical protein
VILAPGQVTCRQRVRFDHFEKEPHHPGENIPVAVIFTDPAGRTWIRDTENVVAEYSDEYETSEG